MVGNVFAQVNDLCDELALRAGTAGSGCVEVLFSCRQTEFANLVCLWAEKMLRYKRLFAVERLESKLIDENVRLQLISFVSRLIIKNTYPP